MDPDTFIPNPPKKADVYILTGFLGSGKTQDLWLREGRSVFQERSDHYPMLPFPVEVKNEPIVLERMMEVMGAIGEAHAG